MKNIAFVAFCVLAACTVQPTSTAPTGSDARSLPTQSNVQTKSANQGIRDYQRVASRIEPVAERICRQQRPSAKPITCDFRIVVDDKDRSGPNAYQTLTREGQPIIAFNLPMLVTIQNDDELAFILGHEAGHQIASHIAKANLNANLGATLLGTLASLGGAGAGAVAQANQIGGVIGARAYSQDHELQADVIGTYIADAAGYDPLRGAKSFARFRGGGGFLATHPTSPQRFARVQATAQQIANGVPLRVR